MLSRLKDFEIDRGVRRLAYSGKAHVPSLPEFTKLCRMVADDSVDEGPQKLAALPNPAEFDGDEWDIEANQRLLKFMTELVSKRSKAFGKVLPMKRIMLTDKHGIEHFSHLESQASEDQIWSTQVLVSYKKAWARDMREFVDGETGEIGRPSSEYRKRTWDDTIKRAMDEIAARIPQ